MFTSEIRRHARTCARDRSLYCSNCSCSRPYAFTTRTPVSPSWSDVIVSPTRSRNDR